MTCRRCPVAGPAEGEPTQVHTDLCREQAVLREAGVLWRAYEQDLADAGHAVARGDLDSYRAHLAAAKQHRAKVVRAMEAA